MSISAGAAGAFAAAVAVPIIMRGLAKAFPASPPPVETALTLDELRTRYKRWELGIGLGAIAGAAPVAVVFWLALRALAAGIGALPPPAEVAWTASSLYWAIPAMFLGGAATLPVRTLVARRLLVDRYPEYLAYMQLKSGMDVQKVARILGTVMSVGAAAFVFLGLDWCVRADRDGLTLNRFLSVGEERHPWTNVREIRTAPALVAPNGNRVERREYVLRFADGRSWSTNQDLAHASPAEKRRLVSLVAERSGVRIDEVALLRNDEL